MTTKPSSTWTYIFFHYVRTNWQFSIHFLPAANSPSKLTSFTFSRFAICLKLDKTAAHKKEYFPLINNNLFYFSFYKNLLRSTSNRMAQARVFYYILSLKRILCFNVPVIVSSTFFLGNFVHSSILDEIVLTVLNSIEWTHLISNQMRYAKGVRC